MGITIIRMINVILNLPACTYNLLENYTILNFIHIMLFKYTKFDLSAHFKCIHLNILVCW